MKRKAGPTGPLIVEGLSGGMGTEPTGPKIVLEPDDFDPNELIPVLVPPEPRQPIKNWGKHQREKKQAQEDKVRQAYLSQQRRAQELIRQRINPQPKPIEPAHNQVHTETGLVITVGKAKGLRRL